MNKNKIWEVRVYDQQIIPQIVIDLPEGTSDAQITSVTEAIENYLKTLTTIAPQERTK